MLPGKAERRESEAAELDWYVDTTNREAVTEVRAEIGRYLRRHAADLGQIPDAELVVAELLGNAMRHASGHAWVSLLWSGKRPSLTVYDLGPGFVLDPHLPEDPYAANGRGLYLVDHVADRLTGEARRAGGMEVSAVLPVERSDEASFDPPRRRENALPDLDEAGPDGFPKEAFLRALVVQLAQTVESAGGPSAAEAAVAQVGADVGGQMEAEYRATRGIAGRLTPQQLAECYVRLKHAIDGEFYVIEASEDCIVLGNRRCPFGDAVHRAPALCRMTSSVFGGIAARNCDHEARVVLEERIAIGDPQCRVSVYLDRPVVDDGVSHRYQAPRGG